MTASNIEEHLQDILEQLEKMADAGWDAILEGDYIRYEVEDSEFSEVVPEDLEEKAIEAMVSSGKWERGSCGFNLPREEEDDGKEENGEEF